MRKRGKLATLGVITALAAFGALTLGGGPAGAVVLHPLVVHANTSIECHWTVDKSASFHGSPVSHLTLAIGEEVSVDYSIVVTKTCVNHVRGTVTGDGLPTSVAVTAGDASGSCTPITAVGDTFTCYFDLTPSTTDDGTVNATADYGGGVTASGSTAYSFAGAPVSDGSIRVEDTYPAPGTVLDIHLSDSKTYHYSRTISFKDCGHFTVDNTASIFDGTFLGSDTVSIAVDVPCHNVGCTLTQGYWKTHSKYGPAAKPDPTWNLLPGGLGPDTVFFKSGQTWIQVFNTPVAGNVYYDLAHQYEAAVLNILNGASSTPAVDAAIAAAANFFNTYTPAQAGALAKSSTARQNAIGWAATLGSYNEGAIGPGHCDEDH
jgi:hypothetical protein